MSTIAHAALFTIFVWWFTTGAIIFLDGLPRRTFVVSMTVATGLLLVALHGLALSSSDTSVTGAYIAFSCALIAWGWNEMGFLMGIVTGPRDTPCPEGARGFDRLVYAIQAVMYHEALIAVTAFAILVVTAGGANQAGLWTFMLLWVMRLSAKINVFLGVPNITEEFLPPHLVYLKTYFRIRPMNAAFPICITAITLLTAYLAGYAVDPKATPFEVTAFALLSTLSALALIEHWFMVLPIPATALWQWGLTSHAANAVPSTSHLDRPFDRPPVVAPVTAALVTSFHEATGISAPDATSTVLAGGPLMTRSTGTPTATTPARAALPATIVPFPASTNATHRRRP